jgi:hypothetical protein
MSHDPAPPSPHVLPYFHGGTQWNAMSALGGSVARGPEPFRAPSGVTTSHTCRMVTQTRRPMAITLERLIRYSNSSALFITPVYIPTFLSLITFR